MLKKPNILVVGSFMMDLIASTKRAPNSGETVIGLKFQTAPGEGRQSGGPVCPPGRPRDHGGPGGGRCVR